VCVSFYFICLMYYVLPTVLGYERCISRSIYNKRIVSVYKSSSVKQSLY
jgi:hypothetical protein